MDEEKFYREQQQMPPRHPTYNPFGYAPVLNTSNRKWAKWVARFILFLIPIVIIISLSSS